MVLSFGRITERFLNRFQQTLIRQDEDEVGKFARTMQTKGLKHGFCFFVVVVLKVTLSKPRDTAVMALQHLDRMTRATLSLLISFESSSGYNHFYQLGNIKQLDKTSVCS